MNLLPLSQFASEIAPGMPLPWGVRDSTGKLLLARGFVIADAARVAALLDRGMFVDAEEAEAARAARGGSPRKSPAVDFIERWERLLADLAPLLQAPEKEGFVDRVREAALQVESLSEVHTDLLIFMILRQDPNRRSAYSVSHALHVAAVCGLLGRRMQWGEAQRRSCMGAALTMNLPIIELQGRLAQQPTPPSPAQRQQIQEHPVAAAALLRKAGLDDDDWLAAVEQHHEVPGGGGYPANVAAPSPMALMLRYADMYTAKLSPRADRPGMAPNVAARELFKETRGDPMVATLIKEFGIYPPGCFVKLHSGETAIVLRRAATASTPVVAALTNGQGASIANPVRRETAQAPHAIVDIVPDKNVMVRVPWDKLYEQCVLA